MHFLQIVSTDTFSIECYYGNVFYAETCLLILLNQFGIHSDFRVFYRNVIRWAVSIETKFLQIGFLWKFHEQAMFQQNCIFYGCFSTEYFYRCIFYRVFLQKCIFYIECFCRNVFAIETCSLILLNQLDANNDSRVFYRKVIRSTVSIETIFLQIGFLQKFRENGLFLQKCTDFLQNFFWRVSNLSSRQF